MQDYQSMSKKDKNEASVKKITLPYC